LGEAREPLTPDKVRHAWRIVLAASGIMVILVCLALVAVKSLQANLF